MSFSDRLAGWRENLRHRWMYRRGDGTQDAAAAGKGSSGFGARIGGLVGGLNRPGMGHLLKRVLSALVIFVRRY